MEQDSVGLMADIPLFVQTHWARQPWLRSGNLPRGEEPFNILIHTEAYEPSGADAWRGLGAQVVDIL